jgi:hypothetical protein
MNRKPSLKSILKPFISRRAIFHYATAKLYLRNSPFNLQRRYNEWLETGKPLPPPHVVKQLRVEECARTHGLTLLVETGTYLGDMVYSQRNNFAHIISIELSHHLFAEARERFHRWRNIQVLCGDSGEVLRQLLKTGKIDQPCLFWLDGHYSGNGTALGKMVTPVFEELDAILSGSQKCVILIDDARLFNGNDGYPTIENLREFVDGKTLDYSLKICDDIILVEYERKVLGD